MRIVIDFDGTIVTHEFPAIGVPVPEAIEWMKRFKEAGAQLILWTMRSDGRPDGDFLAPAVEYCRENGVEFDAVNQGIDDREWTTSPKAYANIYIDDAAFGCPLIEQKGGRPFVNWMVVGPLVMEKITGVPYES